MVPPPPVHFVCTNLLQNISNICQKDKTIDNDSEQIRTNEKTNLTIEAILSQFFFVRGFLPNELEFCVVQSFVCLVFPKGEILFRVVAHGGQDVFCKKISCPKKACACSYAAFSCSYFCSEAITEGDSGATIGVGRRGSIDIHLRCLIWVLGGQDKFCQSLANWHR